MKLGKALSTGYAQDAYDDSHADSLDNAHGHDTDRVRAEGADRVPDPVKVTAETAERPRQTVGAAAR